MSVTVIGLDGAPLSAEAAAALFGARIVVGGARNLGAVELPAGSLRIELGPLEPALSALAAAEGPSVVLASGDPGFFGIVRALREHGILPTVLPALSSVQRAFAAIGRSWDDAVVVSAHGRKLRRAVNVCRARDAVAVFTAPGAGPAELATALRGWPRTFVVAEDLGGPAERVSVVSLAEAAASRWVEPNLVLCLRDPEFVPPVGWLSGEPWTAPLSATELGIEVCASVVAHLDPVPGQLVWVMGTGASAVAEQCARRGAAVLAIDTADVGELPAPDAIYLGGGAAHDVWARTAASTIVVLDPPARHLAAAQNLLRSNGFNVQVRQLTVSSIGAGVTSPSSAADSVVLLVATR